jgi:hypothetical protein
LLRLQIKLFTFATNPQRRCALTATPLHKATAMATNNTAKEVRRRAAEETDKDFAADWGGFWMIAGNYIGMYAMAVLGFVADFAVAFSLIYGATRSTFAALLSATAICAVIQYGYGGATFRITKAIKTGRISQPRYLRSAIIAGAFGGATLGASLYLSYHFDSVFEVASEPQAEAEMKDEGQVNAYYDDKIATLRTDYETERNALQEKRNGLQQQRNEAGEVLWTARRSLESIDKKQAPALRSGYEAAVAALEAERAQRLQQTIATNAATSEKWRAKIMEGSQFTRWFNIAINIARLVLIVGWVVFLMDVDEDRKRREEEAMSAIPSAPSMPLRPVAFPAPATPQNAVSNGAQRREPVDLRGVARDLERWKAKARAYRSKIQRNEGNAETNEAGLAQCVYEIERLSAILASVK